MNLYKTSEGIILHDNTAYYLIPDDWDVVVNRNDLHGFLSRLTASNTKMNAEAAQEAISKHLLPPIGNQEVWAAGVTYLRSRDARMEESQASGGATLYDHVYEADRPELFFKALAHRVQGHGQQLNIRRDSVWNVPEPECALFINSNAAIQGYTIGNDMSSRSIEGENALYLPQAKVYEKSAAIGPCLHVPEHPLAPSTRIAMDIFRGSDLMYSDATTLGRMKRRFEELVSYLFAEMDFPFGCYLMTGTCLVPDSTFTLRKDDRVNITIDGIGTLASIVGIRDQR